MGKAVVVGSINRDIVAFVTHHPCAGETVLAQRGALFAGGKGANQAVAIARLGGEVSLIGRVGDDAFGTEMRAYLAAEHVDVGRVEIVGGCLTGLGLITVDATGQNVITVISGANAAWGASALEIELSAGDVIVCQLEIPLSIVATAFAAAKAGGALTVLNAAPYQALSAELLAATDVLIVNEMELAALAGVAMNTADVSANALTTDMARVKARGPGVVVVTLGADGVMVLARGEAPERIAGCKVQVRDTTGAGDCFVGAFVAEMLRGKTPTQAARFANTAAAMSVTLDGASDSIPKRVDVERWLADQG